jgi:hypothetical protein
MCDECDDDLEALESANGGYWGEHPDFPASDWRADVANGDTRRGYWEWCESQVANAADAPS